ncbi:beta-1,4-galactosyltransferase galt-1-like [Liolophura sinensis]|uniref:beta-1,4-galactosyltransferase galt-1-like n=1 Tax=Liolophura sinensis TaxID=3198878 RepID=UPI003159116C
MASRPCYYLLIIIFPYLLMILLFYHEIEEAENSRKAAIQRFLRGPTDIPVAQLSVRPLMPHTTTTLKAVPDTVRFNVLQDKHFNKNPRSNAKKPQLAKLRVKVKAQSKGNLTKRVVEKVKHVGQGESLVLKTRGQRENQDSHILLDRQEKEVPAVTKKKFTTTPRYQVPKPLINNNCLQSPKTSSSVGNYGFHNISNIHVFSVYYDNRDTPAHIRLIVLKNKTDDRTLLCGFGKNGHLYIVPTESYEMCENHDKPLGGWILSCSIPAQIKTVPCHVYLSLSVDGFRKKHRSSVLKMNITMATTDKGSSKKDFGVCVPPIFGDVSIISLVQFVELSKLLGASDFTFYHTNTSPSDVDQVLRYYQKKREITVIPWILPGNASEKILWYYGQILAIQDCLYRNMARFKYLVFNDLDEFIVPRNATTWSEMVEEIFKDSSQINLTSSNTAGFAFKSAFFSPKEPIDGTYKVRFLQYFYRTKTFSSLRTKMIVKPRNIFELGIHHISHPIKNAVTVPVDPSIALIHHYRTCSSDYDNSMKCHPTTEDLTLLKYAPLLQGNYIRTMDEIVSALYGMR